MDSQTVSYYSSNAIHLATRYDGIVSSLSHHFETSFLPNSKLLDIGCGSGRDLSILHTLGHDCYGIDPTPEFVTLAQQAHPELIGRIAKGCLPELSPPFNGAFDGVLGVMATCGSLSVILCAGHNQRQGGVLCQAEPNNWTARSRISPRSPRNWSPSS